MSFCFLLGCGFSRWREFLQLSSTLHIFPAPDKIVEPSHHTTMHTTSFSYFISHKASFSTYFSLLFLTSLQWNLFYKSFTLVFFFFFEIIQTLERIKEDFVRGYFKVYCWWWIWQWMTWRDPYLVCGLTQKCSHSSFLFSPFLFYFVIKLYS